ncbi:threonine-phosphate decarboxylase CobD [Azoarcus sp. KH32C]|uniref:threonine-phosphate decarboxylase CobD n=1 Tax=Azoarcus sp. KH32C TaxID=748247 RepID=UPI0002385DA1|nr:threonine-phosphate decarboxylase CobD [Azoarcus sp. KH32C]BAL27089.1 cobalamin biosynthetic protein/threonine-phosphate decarboxylase [Azoarcus sp. KH32C]
MLYHGGRVIAASLQYGIPPAEWLDLSTGINPRGWPVPSLSPACWQRLPEEDDGLEAAAATYYGSARLLPVPGSQAAIQTLPSLFPRASVAVLGPLYNEHPQAWTKAGHEVRHMAYADLAQALEAETPVVVLCNPNNPTAGSHPRPAILGAAKELQGRGGWLVVDEAFADPLPADSVAALAGSAEAPNLIVLRSPGKFFGLAGARVGFAFAAREILVRLREIIGPWAVAGPSREVTKQALADRKWQAETRETLLAEGRRLQQLLAPLGQVAGTPLFATVTTDRAHSLVKHFAERAILVRHYDPQPLVRFGLPANEIDWQRLAVAISEWR